LDDWIAELLAWLICRPGISRVKAVLLNARVQARRPHQTSSQIEPTSVSFAREQDSTPRSWSGVRPCRPPCRATFNAR